MVLSFTFLSSPQGELHPYTLSNSTELTQEARNLAMQDAMSKAKELALLSGVELGNVVMITDTSYSNPSPAPMPAYDMGGAGDAPVSGGQLAVTATITVRFEILQRTQ